MVEEDSIDGLILVYTELSLVLTKNEFGMLFLNNTKIYFESMIKYCLYEKQGFLC